MTKQNESSDKCGKCGKKYKSYLIIMTKQRLIDLEIMREVYGDRICKECRLDLMGVRDKKIRKAILKQKDFVC